MNEVEQATHVLNNLRQKREVLVARGVELADERASIALAAHTGDNKASKRLLEINAERHADCKERPSRDERHRDGESQEKHLNFFPP
jgi:hypothetical protein